MKIDDLKQQILMLRRQRAAVQVQLARAHVERHTTLIALDKDIAEKTTIVLDLDVQIAEETRKYATIQANGPTPKSDLRDYAPHKGEALQRPLGDNGEMIYVSKWCAGAFDSLMRGEVVQIAHDRHPELARLQDKSIQMLILHGATWQTDMAQALVMRPDRKPKSGNPIPMPEPRK